MLSGEYDEANAIISVNAGAGGTDAQVAVVVASSYHTGLVGSTHAPCAVVVPERFRTDVSTTLAVIPFQVAVYEVLPGVVVLGLMLPRKACIKSAFIEQSDTKGYSVGVRL